MTTPLDRASVQHAPACARLDGAQDIPADITLYRVNIEFDASLHSPVFEVLSDAERCQAARFVRHADAIRFATTRAALRRCLGDAIGIAAASIRWSRTAAGRPRLAGVEAPVDFNVSHSGEHALIAWARRRRVGVDIERRGAMQSWQALVSTVCGRADVAGLEAAPPPAQRDLFYDIWVAKEALLKAHGAGIGAGLTQFSVLSHRGQSPRPSGQGDLANALAGYQCAWLRGIEGHAACVAWSAEQLV